MEYTQLLIKWYTSDILKKLFPSIAMMTIFWLGPESNIKFSIISMKM